MQHSVMEEELMEKQLYRPTGWVNYNGVIVPAAEARISVYDRGFLFGDSIYEVIRTYNNIPFCIKEHLTRLKRSAEMMGMEDIIAELPIETEVLRTIAHAHFDETYLRIIITRGEGPIGLQTELAMHPNMLILAQPYTPSPDSYYRDGIHVIVVSIMRNPVNALNPAIKSGNYLNNLLALREARLRGGDDAAMLDMQGNITEASTSNLFFVIHGILVTPPLEVGILDGITRKLLLRLLKDSDIPFQVRHVSVREVDSVEECFISSSLKEVMPVTRLNNKLVGTGTPGALTRRIANLFRAYVGMSPRYSD